MSKFTTHIPVAVEDVIETLPKGSHVNGTSISQDKRSFVVEWENDEWRTPYTMAVEVPPEMLTGKTELTAFIKTPERRAAEAAKKPECKKVQSPAVASPQKTGVKAKRVKTTGQPPAATGDQPGSTTGQD